MGNTSNPLVSVNFRDLSSYTAVTDTSDVAGVMLDASWGPCGSCVVCDSSSYRSVFSPFGLGRLNGTMATVLRYFSMGGGSVEGVRLGGHEQYMFMLLGGTDSLSVTGKSVAFTGTGCADTFTGLTGITGVALRLLYPGGFPLRVTLSAGSMLGGVQLYTLTTSAYSGTDSAQKPVYDTVVETLSVSFEPLTLSGVSYYYGDVISAQSSYLYVDSVYAATATGSFNVTGTVTLLTIYPSGVLAASDGVVSGSTTAYIDGVSATVGGVTYTGTQTGVYMADSYEAQSSIFMDRDISQSTILLNSYISDDASEVNASTGVIDSAYTGYLSALSVVANTRKDVNFLCGYPTVSGGVPSGAGSVYSWGAASTAFSVLEGAIKAWFALVGGSSVSMFVSGLVAWEQYTVSTLRGRVVFNLDGTAGWAGRMASTAYQLQNRNQLPSYKAYGSYPSTLMRSLAFSDVVTLHDTDGICSIYSSAVGNYIFGIRTLYGVGQSYFARLNVMRVVAALLAGAFDRVEGVIHTDVTANRSSRLALESQLNSFVGQFISRSELKAASYADCGDALNTDAETNGGRILNVDLVCYFISLTEAVHINVIATDGSVDAQITM